jgi:autotransporter-associated beta strand protein
MSAQSDYFIATIESVRAVLDKEWETLIYQGVEMLESLLGIDECKRICVSHTDWILSNSGPFFRLAAVTVLWILSAFCLPKTARGQDDPYWIGGSSPNNTWFSGNTGSENWASNASGTGAEYWNNGAANFNGLGSTSVSLTTSIIASSIKFSGSGDYSINTTGSETLSLTAAGTDIEDDVSSGMEFISAPITSVTSGLGLDVGNANTESSAVLVLAGSNTYTGGTSVTGYGTFELFDGAVLNNNGLLSIGANATVQMDGSNALVNGLSGGGTLKDSGSSATFTDVAPTGTTTFTGTISGLQTFVMGSHSTGIQEFSSAVTNTSNGGTTLDGGTLGIHNDAALGTGPLTFGGGTLELINYTSNLSFSNTPKLSLGASSSSILTGSITGTSALTFVGPGSLELTNTGNNYSRGTIIDGGTLLVDSGSSISSTGSGSVTVNSGGTLGTLSNTSGDVGGSVTVNSGGNIAPGDPATLNVGGNLTLNSGSQLTFTLNNPNTTTGNDLIQMTGTNVTPPADVTLSLNPGVTLNLTADSHFGTGTYELVAPSSNTIVSDASSNFLNWNVDLTADTNFTPNSSTPFYIEKFELSANPFAANSLDLNVSTSSTAPTLGGGGGTSVTVVQNANSPISYSTKSNPVVNLNVGGQNSAFYLARGTGTNTNKAFTVSVVGFVNSGVQIAPGTPYFNVGPFPASGFPLGNFGPGGAVAGPGNGPPPSDTAPASQWFPAFYAAPIVAVFDPPATPTPTYYGESYTNPLGLVDLYLADQTSNGDVLPETLDTGDSFPDDDVTDGVTGNMYDGEHATFDYQGSFLDLVNSILGSSYTDLGDVPEADIAQFEGSFGVDPANDIAWAVDDIPNADYTVIGISVPLPPCLPACFALLICGGVGVRVRRHRRKNALLPS